MFEILIKISYFEKLWKSAGRPTWLSTKFCRLAGVSTNLRPIFRFFFRTCFQSRIIRDTRSIHFSSVTRVYTQVSSSKLTKRSNWSPLVRKTVLNVFPKLVFMDTFWHFDNLENYKFQHILTCSEKSDQKITGKWAYSDILTI